MRKVNVILMAFVLLLSTTILTAAENPTDPKNNTSEEIYELLKDPGFVIEVETTAFVTFVVNKENEIVVLSVKSNNEAMEKFIKQRLNYKKIESYSTIGKEYIVPVRMTADL
ncbi:MAG: hypothetical protein ACI9SJ_000373 [Flavobacteriaceae bacterium]|jgi:hypothetical protein|uniref:hypothetical protein n=1 Tax=Candidatus Marifrigoribacter sp. Uisw_064 TaxID=3230970 RepID=UPI003AEC49FD